MRDNCRTFAQEVSRGMSRCKRLLICLLLWVLLGTSTNYCSAAPIGDVVGDFDAGVQQSASAVRKFYLDLNDFERNLYFDKLLFDGKQEMGLTQNGQNTAILQRFSDDEIQARVMAINTISTYSRGLVQLASPDRAKRTEQNMSTMGNTMGRINKEISALASSANNPAVAKYAGPIGVLAGLAAKYWMGFQREKALRATIQEGAPQIESLFDLLEADVNSVMKGAYKNGAQNNLGEYMAYYNNHLVGSENAVNVDATRISYLRSAQASAERYAHIAAADPLPMIEKMRKVHQDLLKWAQQKNAKPESIDGLLDDLDSYLSEVGKVTDALSSIQRAGK